MSTQLIFVIVAVVVLAILGALAPVIRRMLAAGGGKEGLPYEREEALFTAAERSFLGVLAQAVGERYAIFGKIRLADIVRPRCGLSQQQRYAALNRIISKHVDFVLCEPSSLQVVGVIELDDRSHQSERRRERDLFLDGALAAAGIPVLHVTAQRTYTVADIQRQISEAFKIELFAS
jgi:hypothetical protein